MINKKTGNTIQNNFLRKMTMIFNSINSYDTQADIFRFNEIEKSSIISMECYNYKNSFESKQSESQINIETIFQDNATYDDTNFDCKDQRRFSMTSKKSIEIIPSEKFTEEAHKSQFSQVNNRTASSVDDNNQDCREINIGEHLFNELKKKYDDENIVYDLSNLKKDLKSLEKQNNKHKKLIQRLTLRYKTIKCYLLRKNTELSYEKCLRKAD